MTALATIFLMTVGYYGLFGMVFAGWIFVFLCKRPEQLHAMAYLMEDFPKDKIVTERQMILVITLIAFLLWPLMVVSMINSDGNWRG